MNLKTALYMSVLPLLLAGPASRAAPANPFAAPSTLPLQAPRFDIIKDGDYQPAFLAAMKQQIAEVEAIANNPAPPTFQNTIVALEVSGRMLDRVSNTFSGVVQANTNPTLDKVQSTVAPLLAGAPGRHCPQSQAVCPRQGRLRPARFAEAGSESAQLLKIDYFQFIHAGANLSDKDKTRLKEINKQDASLETDFQQKLVAAAKAGALVVDDKSALAGLSDAEITNAGNAAKERGLKGKFVIPLQNTTQQPLLTTLANRDTREKLFHNGWVRTEKGDKNDTRAIIAQLAVIRAEKAKLLGYPNYSAYVLYDQMAQTPQAVEKFIGQLVPATRNKAAEEARLIQAAIDKDASSQKTGRFDLKPWDWQRLCRAGAQGAL